jgi:hypothetical protein
MAGKKIKCRNCGKVFSVPGGGEDELDLSGLQADEAAAGLGDDDLMSGTSSGTRAGASHGSRTSGRVGSDPSKGIAHKRARTGDAGDIPIATPGHDDGPPRRKSLPFDFPGADVLDNVAPILLIVLGLGWLALMAFNSNNTGVGWVGMLRMGLYVLLYVALAFPLCYAAVKWAAKSARFMLPPSPALRAFGAFALPFAMAFAFWLSGQSAVSLILGTIVGAVIAGAAVWFLFRVQPHEMGNALGGATGAFAASIVASYLVLLGVNMIFSAVMTRADTNQLSRSPVAPAFAWDVSIKTPGDTVKATDGGGRKILIATRSTTDQTTDTAPPETVPTQPTTTTAPAATQDATTKPITTQAATPVPPPPTDTKPPPPVVPASPFVEQVTPANLGQYSDVLFPATPSNFMAVVKTTAGEFTDDVIEIWSVNPPEKTPMQAQFRRDRDAFGGYALSPNGELIARMNAWPALSIQVQSLKDGKVVKEFPVGAPAAAIRAGPAVAPGVAPAAAVGNTNITLIGFATDNALVVQSIDTRGRDWIEVLNVKAPPAANQRIVSFEVARFEKTSGNPSISPNGTKLAFAANVGLESGIAVFDIAQKRGNQLIKTFPVQINPWIKPVGLAWNPTSQSIAAYWDDGSARGVLYNCSLVGDPKFATKTHLYPIAPYPANLPRTYKGRTFDWLPDGNSWLLFGEHLVDVETGKKLGELAIPTATSQRIVDKEQVAIQSRPPEADAQNAPTLSVVKLKPDAINNKRLELKRAGGTAASIGH